LGAVTNRVSRTYRFSIDGLVFLTYQTEVFGFFYVPRFCDHHDL
jgi:hypothetical protein